MSCTYFYYRNVLLERTLFLQKFEGGIYETNITKFNQLNCYLKNDTANLRCFESMN